MYEKMYTATEMRSRALQSVVNNNGQTIAKIAKAIHEAAKAGCLSTYCTLTYEEAAISEKIIIYLESLGYKAEMHAYTLFIEY